jgi:hypothetical protein
MTAQRCCEVRRVHPRVRIPQFAVNANRFLRDLSCFQTLPCVSKGLTLHAQRIRKAGQVNSGVAAGKFLAQCDSFMSNLEAIVELP